MIKKRILGGVAGLFLVTVLMGCDQVSDQWATLTGKKPEDVLQVVNQKVSGGQFKEALQDAERYLAKDGPLRPQFALAAARASAQLGDVDAALASLTVAIRGMGLSAVDLMSDPAFRSLQTNVRFLALITDTASAPTETQALTATTSSVTQQASNPTPQPKPQAGVVVDSGGGASIQINRQGTEVRAGDITIKLPN